jgi:7-cyano-7-deazaguanine synthase
VSSGEAAGAARPTAVVLLSGGLDSATCLAIALAEGFSVHALTFSYGQRHAVEIDAARRIADRYEIPLTVRALPDVAGSSLTGYGDIPKDDDAEGEGIPSTYVPVRNTVFLAHALQLAEILESDDIFIGVNAVDYSGYPDCRPEFIEAFDRVAKVCSKRAVEGHPATIRAPLIRMTKAEIIRRGIELGVDYGLTRSCYDPAPDGAGCGRCDACRIRLRAFAAAGCEDPAPYVDARAPL